MCYSDSSNLQYTIAEEIRKGSFVGNLAQDLGLNIKELSVRKFHIVSDDSEKYFTVKLENGNLYVAERIDRETLCGEAELCFLTFDALVKNPLNVFHVKIQIQDINDNAPIFFREIIRLEILESTLPGARFVLQNARDPDLGSNSVQNYKLSASQYFKLGKRKNAEGVISPEIVLDNSLDRELQSTFELILTAYDGGNPIQSGSTLLKIFVTDVNDNFPLFAQEVYKVSLNENASVNTTVLQLKASDKDEGLNAQITYSFSNIPEYALKLFSINPDSGEIKTKEMMDYELANRYEMFVQAQDGGGLASHANVIIKIIDVNDNAPEITINSISSPITEDASPGTLVALINVRDKDFGENGEVSCQIKDALPFKLLLSSGSYYKIFTTAFMDREKIPQYNITVEATDKGSPPLSTRKTIILDISDINDNPPIFEKKSYIAYVTENNSPGASIFNIYASDLDIGENAKLTYFILNSSAEELSLVSFLSINPVTGVIYGQHSFDYEKQKEFNLQVVAKDHGSPSLSSNVTLKICIVDQNDNAPHILYPSPEIDGSTFFEMVPPTSEQGYLVTKVVAVDADSGHNAWLSYHFIQTPEPSYFNIDQNNGEIRTSRGFQEKDSFRQKVVIMVKDNGTPSFSATVTLNLVAAVSFQQILPEIVSHPNESDSQYNLQFYLVIALALISFLFLLTVIMAVISKYRKLESSPNFSSLNTNIYSNVDPRLFSRYSNGTLSLPFSYDVCVALDSSENDFSFLKPNQNVPVASLIDSDNTGIENKSEKETVSDNSLLESTAVYQKGEEVKMEYEDNSIIKASDGENPILTGTALIYINVTDVNDNFPVFIQGVYKVNLNENIEMNSSVLFVYASDKDKGLNAQITYSFRNIAEEAVQTFNIDASSGEIKTKGSVDFEVIKLYEISVQAQEGGGLVSHAKILLQIIDIIDNLPEIHITSMSLSISEDQPGTVVALIIVYDKDSGENGDVNGDNGQPALSATVILNLVVAESLQHIVPELSNHTTNLLFYLFNNGTLSTPYSYDACLTLDSSESDIAILKTKTECSSS
ncbi:protocadherin gamma-B1-like [Bombina bombina]|uniref:protocadherin gamma-B1-like n=1 Tax=Bombina bombina TaxID=8345 RepID=UPI00235AB776|nr:protocadherin gamma-B1-like [Bombina bombina]